MPAEQEARVIANDAVEHDGWLDPVDMMRLARAYLALEAELLAAQEREKALREAVEGYLLNEYREGVPPGSHAAHLQATLAASPSEKPEKSSEV